MANVRPTDVSHYSEQGYCLIEELIPRHLIDAVRTRTLEIAADLPEWPARHFQVLDPDRYQSPSGKPLPGGIQLPASQEDVFAQVAYHPALSDAMDRLLGGPTERFTDQIGLKHWSVQEEQGGRSYHHQDSYYWKIDPRLGCNCWIPLQPADRDAIALAVAPGSHLNWELVEHESYFDDPPMGHMRESFEPFKRHRIPESVASSRSDVLIPMQPGDALFFSNYTWHRSEPNRTGETRAFYAIAYQRKQ
jgi:hypothetical protein